MFLRDIHKGNLAFENADEELSQLVNKLKHMGKGKIPIEKRYFLKNAGLFLTWREKILKNFKSKIIPTKNPDKIPTP